MHRPPSPELLVVPGVSAVAVVHAAGHDADTLWDAVVRGCSGLHPNRLAWCGLDCWIGEVPGLDEVRLPAPLAAWDCRNHRLAWLALQDRAFRQAVAAAATRYGSHRIGVLLGTSTSGIRSTEIAHAQHLQTGHWPAGFAYRRSHAVESLSRFTAEVLGLQGPMATVSTACSSSAKVFLTAQRWMAAGLIDAAVVGGVDSLCLSTLHGFDALQLLSAEPCRPFDAARNGISVGEAGGFVLLDRAPAPLALLGGGESSDAWHMSTPHPEGRGAQDAMHEALAVAGLTPSDIGYVNAHGTATPSNDRAEGLALQAVFGAGAVPVSSSKAVTGHTLGAAGVVEAIVALKAIEHRIVPPTTNLRSADPGLALDLPLKARAAAGMRYAMSNNFGFGGSNCSLIFGRTQ
ncbi:MAG: beta-ketoacyl-ACP synthase [Rubrivivax sp.]|nr:beta-ketoacyl-ACP synthase [Rubrivivax sp.]